MKCHPLVRINVLCFLAICLTYCATQRNANVPTKQITYGQLVVPSSFSPDHDGIEDAWQIENLKPGTGVSVYTFYGELVYRSEGEYIPWNGTYKGKDVPAGNYYYVINIGKRLGNPGGWVAIKR